MKRIVDEYGNVIIQMEELKKMPLTDGRFVFYAKDVNYNTVHKLVVMDGRKPHYIINETDPMVVCVEQGNYAVVPGILSIVECPKCKSYEILFPTKAYKKFTCDTCAHDFVLESTPPNS